MWVNPQSGGSSPANYVGHASQTFSSNALLTSTNTLSIMTINSASAVATFDELRLGATYAARLPGSDCGRACSKGRQQAMNLPGRAENSRHWPSWPTMPTPSVRPSECHFRAVISWPGLFRHRPASAAPAMRHAAAMRSAGLSAAFAGGDLLGVRSTDDATPFGRFNARTFRTTPASAGTGDSLLDDLLLSPLAGIELPK